jgi:hypothetical protein
VIAGLTFPQVKGGNRLQAIVLGILPDIAIELQLQGIGGLIG